MKTILEILHNNREKLDKILLSLKERQGLKVIKGKVYKIYIRDRFARNFTVLEEIK